MLDGQPAPTAKVGVTYTFVPSASDADHDTLTFNVTGLPKWAMFDATTGGISELQSDYRIPSNLSAELKARLGLCVTCGVAEDIKPFRQSEFTVGEPESCTPLPSIFLNWYHCIVVEPPASEKLYVPVPLA